MPDSPIKVLLADDHAVVQTGYRTMLESTADIQVVGIVDSGEAAFKGYFDLHPDLVLMDLSMPGIGGLEAARQILERDEQARILVMTMHKNEILLKRVLDAGVRGYMTKTSDAETIIRAIRQVADGHKFISEEMTDYLVALTNSGHNDIFDTLSPREFEVFILTADGDSSVAIGKALNLSPKTIGTHLSQVRKKLGVSSTAEMTRLAIRHGLIEA